MDIEYVDGGLVVPPCSCDNGSPESFEGPVPWCDLHGKPSIAYDRGFASGKAESTMLAQVNGVTNENRERAARYIYRSRAPIGEDPGEWERLKPSSVRKQTYLRAADEIVKLYLGWDR